MKSYIIKPKSVKKSEIVEREYIFSASRHSDIQINSNFDFLVNLINISKKSVSLKNQKKYFNYVEIGSINTTTGYVEPTYKKSIDISTDSVYQLQKDDILISTVRTYLGGIGIVNQKEQDFVASKALIVLRELKKDINKYYLFGILRTSFFIEQTNLILNASMYPRMDKDSFDKLKISFPTTANHSNPEKVKNLVALIVQNIIDKEEQIKLKNKQIDELIEKELKENQKAENFSYTYPRISEIKEETRLDTGLYEREFKEIDFLIRNYKGGYEYLKDLETNFKSGETPKTYLESENGKYIWVSNKDFRNNIWKNFTKINTLNVKNLVPKNAILFSRRAPAGINQIIVEKQNMIVNDGIKIITIDNITTEKLIFISLLFNSTFYQNILKQLSGGGVFGGMTNEDILNMYFPNFPESTQQEIAKLYYNPLEKNTDLNLENYLEKEQARNRETGIFQLNMEIFLLHLSPIQHF